MAPKDQGPTEEMADVGKALCAGRGMPFPFQSAQWPAGAWALPLEVGPRLPGLPKSSGLSLDAAGVWPRAGVKEPPGAWSGSAL